MSVTEKDPSKIIATLEKALQPFAQIASKWHPTEPNSTRMEDDDSAPTLGQCRAAKRALAASKAFRK